MMAYSSILSVFDFSYLLKGCVSSLKRQSKYHSSSAGLKTIDITKEKTTKWSYTHVNTISSYLYHNCIVIFTISINETIFFPYMVFGWSAAGTKLVAFLRASLKMNIFLWFLLFSKIATISSCETLWTSRNLSCMPYLLISIHMNKKLVLVSRLLKTIYFSWAVIVSCDFIAIIAWWIHEVKMSQDKKLPSNRTWSNDFFSCFQSFQMCLFTPSFS